jgi:hypothetical protein
MHAKIHGEHFNCSPFDLYVPFEDIHALYHIDRMDDTMIPLYWM